MVKPITGRQAHLSSIPSINSILLVDRGSNVERVNRLILDLDKNNTAKIDGYLEDYSYFANALLDVFEIEPEVKYLNLAVKLGHHLVDHFWDSESSSFFMTSDNHEKLIIRPKSNYDLSLPSGNSVSCFVMLSDYFP